MIKIQNPLAEELTPKNTSDAEKKSFIKQIVIKLRTKVYHVRKLVITSELFVHLKKLLGLILDVGLT